MRKLIIVTGISLLVFACSKKTSTPAEPKTPEQLTYESVCSKCHKLHKPSSHTYNEWTNIVDVMQKKGKFDDEVKAQVLAYLKTKAKP